ncbi:hypothetical protein [Achromobacter kerstersii]
MHLKQHLASTHTLTFWLDCPPERLIVKWFLTIIAVLSLAAGLTLGSFGHLHVLWAAVGAALFFLVCANADRIAEVSATREGITAKTRDLVRKTEGAINELQMLAAQLAALGLSLIKRQGRLGGYSVDEEQQLRTSTLEVVRRLGVADIDIRKAMSSWHAAEDFDYVQGILGNSRLPAPRDEKELIEDWKRLRAFQFGEAPTPTDVRSFLAKHQLLDPLRQTLVEDYEYYIRHREHRRPDVWAKHLEWPPLERSTPLPADYLTPPPANASYP